MFTPLDARLSNPLYLKLVRLSNEVNPVGYEIIQQGNSVDKYILYRTHYYYGNMRQPDTLINKFEKAGIVIVLAVLMIRIWLGPESNFPLLVATTIFSIYYLWFGFFIFTKLKPVDLLDKSVVKQIKPIHIYAGIIIGIIISYSLIAILFGFFFYPSTPVLLGSAFILLISFTLFLVGYQVIKRNRNAFFNRFYYRAVLYAIIIALLWLTPLETRLNLFFRGHEDFIEAYLHYADNPDDANALERLRKERSRFR